MERNTSFRFRPSRLRSGQLVAALTLLGAFPAVPRPAQADGDSDPVRWQALRTVWATQGRAARPATVPFPGLRRSLPADEVGEQALPDDGSDELDELDRLDRLDELDGLPSFPPWPPAGGSGGWPAGSARFWDPAERLPYGGALAGRTIVVSPGHGWLWDAALGSYRSQRTMERFSGCSSCRGIIEDLSNAEIVHHHLLPLLEGAGARVLLVRERDFTTAETIVDDQDAHYGEEGDGFSDGTSGGGYRDSYRVLPPGAAGVAHWALEPPVPGVWQLSVRYRAGENRTSAALYRIHAAAGVTEYRVDQRQGNDRWLYLGSHFVAPGEGSFVELLHGPGSDGHLIPDAVRLGGGVDVGSELARWQMAAVHYLPYLGAPEAVTAREDVTIRPHYANWEGADLYLSIHTNAFDGSSSGMSSYRYSCGIFPDWSNAPPAQDCDQPRGSARLQEITHAAVLDELRRSWDPAVPNAGARVANFGELRPLRDIPGVLFELAFHDNLVPLGQARMSDNQAIHDPRWRRAAARGLLRGVVRYLAGENTPLPPHEPPTGLIVLPLEDAGAIRASWWPVAGAQGYRVRVARGGRAFDDGVVVDHPEFLLADAERGVPHYLRVSALGSGGEGPASEVGGARLTPDRALRYAPVLIIQGFDREDAWVQERDNTRSYVLEHGEAIAAAGPFPFGSAANEALGEPLLAGAGGFAVLDWLLGEESTEHESFSEVEQAWLEAWLGAGNGTRGVLASGAEVAWDLDARGSDADRAFLLRVFGAALAGDDAETYSFAAIGEPPFDGADLPAGSPMAFDDGSLGTYDADWPDVLEPRAAGARTVLAYATGGAAAVAHDAGVHRALLLGLPLETVQPVAARAALVGAALRWLLPPPLPPGPDGEDGGVPDGGVRDGGVEDGSVEDGGVEDGGVEDGGVEDGRVEDGGVEDGGLPDGGVEDSGLPDGGVPADVSGGDAAPPDSGEGGGGDAGEGGADSGLDGGASDLAALPGPGAIGQDELGCECRTTRGAQGSGGATAMLGSFVVLGLLLVHRRGT